ncbi:MAG TPA: MarR family transcriptional regulator [Euzebyales bacterium]|nr:MarR family transcriptional regulator [Euzebyales bacterium]
MTPTDALRDRVQAAVVRFIADAILFNHVVAQREGLGPSDGQFITLLQVHGPMTAGELSARSGLTTGSTTGVIDRLERAGLAHRVRDRQDRRRVIVTPDDEAISTRVFPHYAGQAERLGRVLDQRTRDEIETVAVFFEELVDDQANEG